MSVYLYSSEWSSYAERMFAMEIDALIILSGMDLEFNLLALA